MDSKQAQLLQRQTKGRGGGTLICLYIRRLGPFLGFKILNLNFWIFSQKNDFFIFYFFFFWGGGYEYFVDSLWGSLQN